LREVLERHATRASYAPPYLLYADDSRPLFFTRALQQISSVEIR
jgi:hypothetical protein